MDMRSYGTLIAFLAMVGTGYAQAEETNLPPIDMAEQRLGCSAANAKMVPLSELIESPSAYYGQCLKLEGYAFYRSLWIDKVSATKTYETEKDRTPYRIGIYASEADQGSLPKYGQMPLPVIAVGTLNDCKDLARAKGSEGIMMVDEDGQVIMVSGYCHYTGGPFLTLSSYEVRP